MTIVVTMEQGPILQQHIPIDHYSLPSEHDYNDHQYAGHAHHSSYNPGGAAVEHLRREASTSLQAPAAFPFNSANGASGARFDPARGVVAENNNYQTSNIFADSSSGSMSSPSSAASSSLAYTNYPHTHCTSIPSFSGSVQQPQAFTQLPSYNSTRELPNLDSIGSGMPPPAIRPSFSSSAADREAYSNSTPFLARTQFSPGSAPGYSSFADTPRTSLGLNGLSLHHNTYAQASHMASSPTYGGQQNECSNFPWPNLEVHAEMTCEGEPVTPEVHAKVEKGFFLSTVDQKWTCYRRNYFSVQCSFELHPNINNGRMHLKRNNASHTEPIQAMGMRLSAAVDGSQGKNIELVQHTPKRDNGPKNKIDVTKVLPAPSVGRNDHGVPSHGIYQVPLSTFHATGQVPSPFLPLQSSGDGSNVASSVAAQASSLPAQYGYPPASHLPQPGQNTNHTFERVQFKQATANNGKRRASQQYFHLIVELFADVRKDGSADPTWVKVAHRVSEKIVVRGRSPSHYQNEGQHQNGRSGSTSGGSGYGAGGGSTFGNLSTGGFRQSGTSYGGGLGGGNYRTNSTYGHHASPDHSGSSASSVDGGADNEYQADAAMSDAERNDIQTHEGYRYYPGPLYEGIQPGLPLPKIESGARYSTEPSQWTAKYESSDTGPGPGAHWHQAGGMSRFQGVDSSRGYYSDQLVTTYAG